MHISKVLENNSTTFSFEFFPPKTPKSSENLFTAIQELVPLKPSFVSVTYGAGGGTRQLTHDLVMKIKRETGLTVVSHLTCVGSSRDEIHGILEKYHENGIENIMALRGDPPQGSKNYEPEVDGFYYATDLVAFIKKHFPSMGIGVAGYPEGHSDAPNRLKEIDFLKEKIDAGADFITTQLYFDNRDFYDFCERCEIAGINVPIIAGIMPITSAKTMGKMAELSRGTRFPAPLLKAVSRAEGDDYVEKVGVHWATQQVMDLLDKGVSGIHFYTLNMSRATRMVYDSLGVTSSRQLQ